MCVGSSASKQYFRTSEGIFAFLYIITGNSLACASSIGRPNPSYKEGKTKISNLKENGYNQKLQKKATEYARSFTWERTAKDTLSVYKKLLML